jgi:DNA-binding LacI/PurR family transcriptional regulator
MRRPSAFWSLPLEGFTAIMAANDHMALGALRALHAHGLYAPGEISVVGYDDLPESRFFEPPLTTVHHDFAWEGERYVEMLFRAINREPVEPREKLLVHAPAKVSFVITIFLHDGAQQHCCDNPGL